MTIYIERESEGVYDILDVFLNESVSLNTKTTYTQDITAVFKGFTNDFSVQATPNNVRILGYFGFTEQFTPAKIQKRGKLYIGDQLFKEGIITLKNTSWVNGVPSLFALEFSDGQKNLTEILGEDSLSVLSESGGDLAWTSKNIQKALQSIQSTSDGMRWFVPLVSTERIFTINSNPGAPGLNDTDNLFYHPDKPITSENVLLPQEIRPAVFLSDILEKINEKYDVRIDPTPYVDNITQLTDLCVFCAKANVSIKEAKANIDFSNWRYDQFREERFDIVPKPNIDAFELNYLGYGEGAAHDATFDMIIQLAKTSATVVPFFGTVRVVAQNANSNYINSIEVWEVTALGEKKRKLNYSISAGSETRSAELRIRIGLDVFYPEGGNQPSTLVKPLISIFVSADSLSEWKYTNVLFNWNTENWKKFQINNVQPQTSPTTVNLFESLPEMKIIDFVKSIYTMFGYKKFKDKVLNDFYFKQKTVGAVNHYVLRSENDLTPFADLSKLTKKTNTKYDAYNLKHATSEYQQNVKFLADNGVEYGQMKFPLTGKPNAEFKIETKFTAPVFNPVVSNADTLVYTFYPFGSNAKLNDAETRFIYDTNTKEFPIFYYNGIADISTTYGYVDVDSRTLKAIGKYHKISYKNNRIFTGTDNYITSLFDTIIPGDYIDQNTLYVQGFKTYIEDTLSGKKLIHTVELDLPSVEIHKFKDEDEVIIKETKYTVLESDISLTGGKSKLLLLNK